jgi:PAS domain S-box-containing protein
MSSTKQFGDADKVAPVPEVLGKSFAKYPHPMWMFDRETHAFLDVNEAAVRRYGYSREEFLRMTILDIRPTEDIPELLRQTPHPRPQGESTGERWRHRAKDGEVFCVSITSWTLTFCGRQAELVLARREGSE